MPRPFWKATRLPGTQYQVKTLRVSGGDVVVFCSDGLMESENEREEVFESTRLHSVLKKLIFCTFVKSAR